MDIPSGSGSLQTPQRAATVDAARSTAPVSSAAAEGGSPVVRAVVLSVEPVEATPPPKAAPVPTAPVAPPASDVRSLMTVMVNTSRPAPGLPEFSTIDDRVLALARQEKPFILNVTTNLAIPEGARLVMKLHPDGAALLDGKAVAQLPVDVRNALSHALVRQVNPMALLQQLMALNPDSLRGKKADSDRGGGTTGTGPMPSARPPGAMAANTPTSPAGLPAATAVDALPDDTLAKLVVGLQSLVPDLDEVLDGSGIQRFLRHSGIFFESTLARAGETPMAKVRSGAGSPAAEQDGSLASLEKDFKGLLLNLEKTLLRMDPTSRDTKASGNAMLDALFKAITGQQNDTDPSSPDAANRTGKNPSTSLAASPTPLQQPGINATDSPANSEDAQTQASSGSHQKPSPGQTDAQDRRTATLTRPSATDVENKPTAATRRHSHAPVGAPVTPPGRTAPGLAVSQYKSVQRITTPARMTPPTSPQDALPVPGLELPLPLRTSSRRASAASREECVAELLQQTRDTLARTTLHQLASGGHLQEEHATPKQLLSFDLPVMVNGQVQVFNTRIEHEEVWPQGEEPTSKGEKRKEKLWTVSLGFDIEGLGPMFCQLSLVTRDARLQIWSENPDTHRLAESQRDSLEKGMASFGVNLRDVTCHNGMPKQVKTQLTQTLVDITT